MTTRDRDWWLRQIGLVAFLSVVAAYFLVTLLGIGKHSTTTKVGVIIIIAF